MLRPDSHHVFGWDIGGAHVKACLLREGRVVEAVQWPCPLWQGMEHLERVLHLARAHWPQIGRAAQAVTMTGEMTDLFEHREDGVRRIAATLARTQDAARAPGVRGPPRAGRPTVRRRRCGRLAAGRP